MKFSISVPIGAWHEQLPTALQSLFIQYSDMEIAILDASADARVKELIDHHAGKFSYIRHGRDLGQSDAIIEGWQNTDGDWLGWLNADDALMPKALQRVEQARKTDPSLDVIYGHSIILDDEKRLLGYHFNVEPPGPRLLESGIISQPSCFFSRKAYDQVGGLDRDLHYVMDWDLWIRMYLKGASFGFIDFPLSQVVWGDDTKTASLGQKRRRELRQLIDRNAPERERRSVFRDFIIHTAVDKVWPPLLRRRLQMKLRSVGNTLFGIRADGLVGRSARIFLPVFEPEGPMKVRIKFSRSIDTLSFVCADAPHAVEKIGDTAVVVFTEPLVDPQLLEIEILNPVENALYFEGANWA